MQSNAELVSYLKSLGYIKRRYIEVAFLSVDRKHFVPRGLHQYAYFDEPLPIESGQTISAPSIVAMMTEALNVKRNHVVLEVGSGSGYQAAILSKLSPKVHSIELDVQLSENAERNCKAAGVENVSFHVGNGADGLPQYAPFDRIIVTAAATSIPPALEAQLKENGVIIIPLSTFGGFQKLFVGEKKKSKLTGVFIADVVFVPLR